MKPNQNISPNKATLEEKSPLVMVRLKLETTSSHKRLERTSCLARLFELGYTVQEYRDLLCHFYGFFSAIEPLIFDNLEEAYLTALGDKTKSHLLARDIALFGASECELKNIPRCDKLPNLNSFARKMGCLYVLEGSTLGGRIISKRLKDHFGTAILDKLNYYNCYGENVGIKWKEFQVFMASQFDDSNGELPDVIAAANDTFKALYQWLEQSNELHALHLRNL